MYQKFNQSTGVYPIQVDIQTIVNTYCLEEGWTIIQSRGQYGNPIDYFFKTWAEYKDGFGKPGKGLFFHFLNFLTNLKRHSIYFQGRNIGWAWTPFTSLQIEIM